MMMPPIEVEMGAHDPQDRLHRGFHASPFGDDVVFESARGPHAGQILKKQNANAEWGWGLHAAEMAKLMNISPHTQTARAERLTFLSTELVSYSASVRLT
jgi:hypothetical protein